MAVRLTLFRRSMPGEVARRTWIKIGVSHTETTLRMSLYSHDTNQIAAIQTRPFTVLLHTLRHNPSPGRSVGQNFHNLEFDALRVNSDSLTLHSRPDLPSKTLITYLTIYDTTFRALVSGCQNTRLPSQIMPLSIHSIHVDGHRAGVGERDCGVGLHR